jgi:hypothetical protein
MAHEEKKEHHMAKAAREKREAEAAGNSDLITKLDAVKALGPQEPIIDQKPAITDEQKEPSIPISEVSKMVAEQVAKAMEGFASNQNIGQAPPQIIYQAAPEPQNQVFKIDYDINDIPELEGWTMKDRMYVFTDGRRPKSETICKQHTAHRSLQYTNKVTQTVLPLRYASNQTSFFMEKQSKEPGSVLSTDIMFVDGMLKVPANNVLLQKFLHIHPDMNIEFKEFDPTEQSRKYVSEKKISIEANNLATTIGLVANRAIASLINPSYTPSWIPSDVDAEVLRFIEKTPKRYLELAKDPSLKMKGIVKTALAKGDLVYENYRFMNRNREILCEVGRNQDELEEMVRYFETGTGRTLYEFLLNINS